MMNIGCLENSRIEGHLENNVVVIKLEDSTQAEEVFDLLNELKYKAECGYGSVDV
ncbi:MAG: hypothetical protein V4501_08270 [Pseudomonadota bacterium]